MGTGGALGLLLSASIFSLRMRASSSFLLASCSLSFSWRYSRWRASSFYFNSSSNFYYFSASAFSNS